MTARVNITPGQLNVSAALVNTSALTHVATLDGNADGLWYDPPGWCMSDGECLLWSVLGWLNGQCDLPPIDTLRAGLDSASWAAVNVATKLEVAS